MVLECVWPGHSLLAELTKGAWENDSLSPLLIIAQSEFPGPSLGEAGDMGSREERSIKRRS